MAISNQPSGTTTSFGEGKALSADLRATKPEQIAATMRELKRIKETAKDYIIGAPSLSTRPDEHGNQRFGVRFNQGVLSGTTLEFGANKIAFEQLAAKFGVPTAYAKRMDEIAPGLLANNFNYWFAHGDGNIMLRTLDGNIRAALSDRYRALDDFDLALHTIDVGASVGAVVQRLDLSPERMFVRLVLPDYAAKITGRSEDLKSKGRFFSTGYKRDNGTWQGPDDDDPEGDWVFPAIVASNSEVGMGKLIVDSAAMMTTCVNYIVVSKAMHRVHLGERLEGGFELSAETREAKDKAIWLEVRDMVQKTFDPEAFRAMVENMNEAQSQTLADPIEAVSHIVKSFGIEELEESILKELISPSAGINRGPTRWGLVNAVNAVGREHASVMAGYQLEQVSGQILADRELVRVR